MPINFDGEDLRNMRIEVHLLEYRSRSSSPKCSICQSIVCENSFLPSTVGEKP